MGRYNIGIRYRTRDVVITDWNNTGYTVSNLYNMRTGMVLDSTPNDFFRTYGWGLPCDEAGNRITYRANNPVPADDQANRDQIIGQVKSAGGTVYAGFWWPKTSSVVDGASNWVIQGGVRTLLHDMVEGFKTSVNKLPRYVLQIGSVLASWDHNVSPATLPPPGGNNNGTWLNFVPNFIPEWISYAQLPNYWRTSDARPIMLLFDDITPAWTLARLNTIRTSFQAAGLPNPFILMSNLAIALTCGADGTYNYCGPNKTGFGTTHKPYTAEATNLQGFFTESSGGTISLPSVATTNDGRARGASGNDVDPATYLQAENIILLATMYERSQINPQQLKAILFANMGEYDESNVIGVTPQIRLFGPESHRGPYLDALQNVIAVDARGVQVGNFPSPVLCTHAGRTLDVDIVRTGTWTDVQNLVDGGTAYQYEEMQTTTLGDTFLVAPQIPCDRIWVYGSRGPGYGNALGQTNGGPTSPIVLTQVSVERTYNNPPGYGNIGNPIWDTGDLTPGLNTAMITANGGLLGIDLVIVRQIQAR